MVHPGLLILLVLHIHLLGIRVLLQTQYFIGKGCINKNNLSFQQNRQIVVPAAEAHTHAQSQLTEHKKLSKHDSRKTNSRISRNNASTLASAKTCLILSSVKSNGESDAETELYFELSKNNGSVLLLRLFNPTFGLSLSFNAETARKFLKG